MISATSSLLFTGTALATEDLDWTGFHIAGGIGYGMIAQNSYVTENSIPITATETSGGKGWLGRVSAGYNYQLPNCFVVGAFADYDFMDLSGQQNFPGLVGREIQNGAWYVGGLMGYVFNPFTMGFIDAGYTGTHFKKVDYFIALSEGGPASLTLESHTYNGWFLGIGMETLLATLKCSELFLRTEYRYSKYGTANIPINTDIALDFDIGDAGLRSRVAGQTVMTSISWAI